jgi:type IV pilus biogenesis protein CpaD/CtpE
MQVAVYAKAAAPSKVEAKAAKALAKAIRAALATLGIKTRGVNVVSGASGSLKNAVVISGS